MNTAVFDTNIIIDALNGIDDAEIEYQRYQKVYISHLDGGNGRSG